MAASTKKIIAIISLTLLLIPASNVFAFSNGQPATIVVGQASLTTGASGTTATALHFPQSSAFDLSGNLWVVDQFNSRVLKYNAPITTGEPASVVIGQASLTTGTVGLTATTLNNPSGISFDSSGNLWVVDQSNNRVLKYNSPISTGEPASVVIGQTSFTTGTVGTSATTLSTPSNIAFDSTGNLWVADFGNNRVLKYLAPITTGEAATVVIGQISADPFTTGISGTSATALSNPSDISFDSTGNLWVTDKANNRVLEYIAPITIAEAATVVVGQASLTTGSLGTTATKLNGPIGSAFDSAGNLWVAENGNSRVMKFPAPIIAGVPTITTGEAATVVIGQTSFTANSVGMTATTLVGSTGVLFDSTGNLWVTDLGNNRILEYPATVSQVTGQVNLIAGTCGINVVSGAPINYGSLIAGSVSTEQTVVVQNTGTVSGTLAVHGTDWLDGSSILQMLVGNTKFSSSPGSSYAAKTALTTGDLPVGTILPTPNLSTYWQLQATPINPSFGGTLTQTVTFSDSC